MDPVEFRRKNLLRIGDTTATSQELTYSVGSFATLDALMKDAGNPPGCAGTLEGSPVRRGRGVATYFHGAGFTGSGEQRLAGRVTVELCADGHFKVLSSSTELGQGVRTIFTQIAATALGVDGRLVESTEPSTEDVPDSGPTVASRTCMVVGALVNRACKKLRARIEAWAEDNDLADAPLERAAEALGDSGKGISETVQYQSPPGIQWDDETYTGSAYPVFGWAACLVDLAVDVDTYEVTIERCIHAVDVGKAIHPAIVEGQIQGGTLQALGWALLENVVYDHGRVQNAHMTDCIVPTFADAPELETLVIEEPYPYGPHGAKGIGELPMDGPAAAVAAAIEQALGLAFDELPILPEVIARRVREEGAA